MLGVLRHQGGEEGEEIQTVEEATHKKLKLEQRRTMIEETKDVLEEKRMKIIANAENAKMLTLNVDSLNADARMIMQFVSYQILQRQDELVAGTYEQAIESDVDAEAEAA
ncbi:putative UDP-N-acetylglucosamine--peptide N-acetylglucosaminyltransferase SPINDLY [Hordeum vulgare]|nr:putative UDP-N-acetylglucosamine--peptide N-acetylglucosaminyltransferase SPINDLY [Hordeum vulgare]